jgi:hypothetical protein
MRTSGDSAGGAASLSGGQLITKLVYGHESPLGRDGYLPFVGKLQVELTGKTASTRRYSDKSVALTSIPDDELKLGMRHGHRQPSITRWFNWIFLSSSQSIKPQRAFSFRIAQRSGRACQPNIKG